MQAGQTVALEPDGLLYALTEEDDDLAIAANRLIAEGDAARVMWPAFAKAAGIAPDRIEVTGRFLFL